MNITYTSLLAVQRDLYRIPRGMERFRQYLRVMSNQAGDDVRYPPLVMLNPMAKDHLATIIDQLLDIDADAIVTAALHEAFPHVRDVAGDFQASLIVADDALGGWTNRYASEFALRSDVVPANKRFWVTGVLWSSDAVTERAVREAILTAVYRTAYVLRHGRTQTLRDLLAQEGATLAAAGCDQPTLDDDDLAYTREVIAPMLDARDHPTLFACLLGDAAAQALGYPPQGLSPRAGLALALHEAGA